MVSGKHRHVQCLVKLETSVISRGVEQLVVVQKMVWQEQIQGVLSSFRASQYTDVLVSAVAFL
jgi:uncharacterized membrane protein